MQQSASAAGTAAGSHVRHHRSALECTAVSLITRILQEARRPAVATNFRPGSAALLHLLQRETPGLPIIWVDTGYNTPATYRYVDRLCRDWQLNLHVFSAAVTPARRLALSGGVPRPQHEGFEDFVREVKLEPFRRALKALDVDYWFTGIRREQTAYRSTLRGISDGPEGTRRVAPLLDWGSSDIESYLERHGIPDNSDYDDPTKPGPALECGLMTMAGGETGVQEVVA